VAGVSRQYGGVVAVSNCSMRFGDGLITGIVGPNGAGKSTLLRLISGDVAPNQGQIFWRGRDITKWPVHERAAAGMVRTFQLGSEIPGLTVLENLLLACQGNPGESPIGALFRRGAWTAFEREATERALILLETIGLRKYASSFAGSLSGGEKRLLEVARAMTAQPSLLLLDEPMVGVSFVMRETLIAMFSQLRDQGVTCVIVEHALDVIEKLCDVVVVMAEGGVIFEGTMADMRSHQGVRDAYLG